MNRDTILKMSIEDSKFQVGDTTTTGTQSEQVQQLPKSKCTYCTFEVKQPEVEAGETTSTAVGATGDSVDVVNKSVGTDPEEGPLGTSVSRCTTSTIDTAQDPDNISNEDDENAEMAESNGMLYSLESGLRTITKHAKDCMEKCSSGTEKKKMRQSLEEWTSQMLKSEQMLKRIPRLAAEVVDELELESADEDLNLEVPQPQEMLFKPKESKDDMNALVKKLQKALQNKMREFEDAWTCENLKSLPEFRMLEEQVAGGTDSCDYEKPKETGSDAVAAQNEGTETESDEASDEELMLPNIDPLTKRPIENPVRNIHCRHVFDEQSIRNYIKENGPGKVKCPLRFCCSMKPMKYTDFAKLDSLTESVKRKNLRVSEGTKNGKCDIAQRY